MKAAISSQRHTASRDLAPPPEPGEGVTPPGDDEAARQTAECACVRPDSPELTTPSYAHLSASSGLRGSAGRSGGQAVAPACPTVPAYAPGVTKKPSLS